MKTQNTVQKNHKCDFMCFSKNHFVLNSVSHWEHLVVFCPLCVFSWIDRLVDFKKPLLQTGQKCDFSLEWRLFSWLRILFLVVDLKSQVWHLYGFNPKWIIFICFLKDGLSCALWPHCRQRLLTPSCVDLLCLFRLPFVVDKKSHSIH